MGIQGSIEAGAPFTRGEKDVLVFIQNRGTAPSQARVLLEETHPAPVTQLWAVGRVQAKTAARYLPDANSDEDSRFCATCA